MDITGISVAIAVVSIGALGVADYIFKPRLLVRFAVLYVWFFALFLFFSTLDDRPLTLSWIGGSALVAAVATPWVFISDWLRRKQHKYPEDRYETTAWKSIVIQHENAAPLTNYESQEYRERCI